MASTSLEMSRQFTSFAGSDINLVINGKRIGSAVAVSYAVQREKGPIFVLGEVNPKSFSRGKRGIAGTIVSLMLDQHWILDSGLNDLFFLADKEEIKPAARGGLNDATAPLEDLEALDPSYTFDAGDLSSSFVVTNAWYPDQLPPFDIVVVAVNEYGKAAQMRIYGCEIMNEGSGFSVDDMRIENQQSYVARGILPWQRMGSWDLTTAGGAFTPVSQQSFSEQCILKVRDF